MHYLALLGTDETTAPDPGTPDYDGGLGGYIRFATDNAGAILAGDALERSAQSVTVRHAGDEPLVTDGPYAETNEAISGYYMLEAETLDDAIDLARQIPAAESGWVALRPAAGWWDYAEDGPTGDKFLAVMYGKDADVSPGTPEWDELGKGAWGFVESARPRKALVAGGAVQPLDTTTTVRVRDGEVLVTDGPFSESAEIVAGFYVLAAADRDAAVALATEIPLPLGGAVEVRPVHVFG